jgi:hypothetical protein
MDVLSCSDTESPDIWAKKLKTKAYPTADVDRGPVIRQRPGLIEV